LSDVDKSRVRRVEGVVNSAITTFGEFTLEADSGIQYDIKLDQELTRRGVTYDVGQRIQVTGPVLFDYDVYKIIVMLQGQVSVLSP
jgi:hypothetical protein